MVSLDEKSRDRKIIALDIHDVKLVMVLEPKTLG